jgi:hypothetical protein
VHPLCRSTSASDRQPAMVRRQPPDPYGTGDMFDVEPLRDTTVKRQTQKSVAQGKCPECTRPKIGLLAQGDHIVWRQHYYTTWHGTPMPCRASGVTACVAPERDPLDPSMPVRCPHP